MVDNPQAANYTEEQLITILCVEIDQATAMCDTVQSSNSDQHRAQLLIDIRTAIEMVRHFQARVEHHKAWNEIQEKTNGLERFVAEGLD